MNRIVQVSNCCNSSFTVEGTEKSTRYYSCNLCRKPCDLHAINRSDENDNKIRQKSKNKEKNKKETNKESLKE